MGFFGTDGRCGGDHGAAALGLFRLPARALPFLTSPAKRGVMTNKIAVWLFLIIVALLAVDYLRYDWANTIFLLRKFLQLIEWTAFWR